MNLYQTDIQALIEKGMLQQSSSGGKSTKLCFENGLTPVSGELYNISLHLAIAPLSPP